MNFAPVRFSAANNDGRGYYIHRRPEMPNPATIQDAVTEARSILTFSEITSIIVSAILGGACSAIWTLRQRRMPHWREVASTILFSMLIAVAITCALLYYANIPMLLVIPTSILSGFGGEVLGRALINLWIEAMVRLFGPKFLRLLFGFKAPAPERKHRRDEQNDPDET